MTSGCHLNVMPLDKKSKCASSVYADKQQTIIGSSLILRPIDAIALIPAAVHQKGTQSLMNRSQPVRYGNLHV